MNKDQAPRRFDADPHVARQPSSNNRVMKLPLLPLLLLSAAALAGTPEPYNVIWDSPSQDARGTLPLQGDFLCEVEC